MNEIGVFQIDISLSVYLARRAARYMLHSQTYTVIAGEPNLHRGRRQSQTLRHFNNSCLRMIDNQGCQPSGMLNKVSPIHCGVEGMLTHEGILAHAKGYAGILPLRSISKTIGVQSGGMHERI